MRTTWQSIWKHFSLQHFSPTSVHCRTVLGLRKSGCGRTTKERVPSRYAWHKNSSAFRSSATAILFVCPLRRLLPSAIPFRGRSRVGQWYWHIGVASRCHRETAIAQYANTFDRPRNEPAPKGLLWSRCLFSPPFSAANSRRP